MNLFYQQFMNTLLSLVFKKEEKLYVLVTDIGYSKTQVVWSELSAIDGDVLFVDENFSKAIIENGIHIYILIQ